jgi:protein AFG1
LYKNGIQRTSFVPAIELLKTQFDVTDLDSGTGPSFSLSLASPSFHILRLNVLMFPDYRRVPRALSQAYFAPLDSATQAAINARFVALTEGKPIQEGKTIRLWGRNLTVPRSARDVAQFTFAELCGRALGAADYLAITEQFRTLFVTDVPRMGLGEKDKVDVTEISPSRSLT